MNTHRQRMVAVLFGVLAGAALALCSAWLTIQYVIEVRQSSRHKAALAQLEQASTRDAARVAELMAERNRQTETSLSRRAGNARLARGATIAAVLFLIAGKWYIALGPRRSPDRLTVLTVRGVVPPDPVQSATPAAAPLDHHRDQEEPPPDPGPLERIVETCGRTSDAVIPLLHAVQAYYRYLPQRILERLCTLTGLRPAQITGVASFYAQFRHRPVGKYLIKVCHGTACHVAGAERISDELRRQLGIPAGADTDAAMDYTIEPVACMGCCTLAPVAQVDGATRGHLTADTLVQAVRNAGQRLHGNDHAHAELSNGAAHDASRPELRIGLGSCCMAGGSADVLQATQRELTSMGVDAHVKRVGCVGMCHQTPLIEALIPGETPMLYVRVQPADVPRIVRRHFRATGLRRRMRAGLATLADRWSTAEGIEGQAQRVELRDPPVAAFLGPQQHIATEHSGRLDPICLDDYLRHDGFVALQQVMQQPPEAVIEQIERSRLRGRGGAGFPTGVKWSRVRAAAGERKFVICNGDEGDPGAFMDRMLMESYPYRIIEGLAIAAYAVGAREGYFYIRAEYPLAVRRVRQALRDCEARGYLGADVLGSGFALRLQVKEGAGAFVCGEETALIASLEGRRGMPALRPPYPAERGFRDAPTLVNNVETLATVPWIIRHGAESFAALGTARSKGTKVFALAGKVKRGGLIEVPMGVTVRQIVEEIGGGMQADAITGAARQFKAVQIGGPSGGCIPASLADTPVDYEALTEVGAIMGSGGLVVLDETDCMVDMARYFLSFTQDQSCGKCTYCRVGTRRMLEILTRLCEGRGHANDLTHLEELARYVGAGSLCGLGRTAPNPVLTTLRYFRDEYEAHIAGHCPAGRCKALIAYRVTERCIGCTLCAQHCPADAIDYRPHQAHEIDAEKCTRCDICRVRCPEHAIVVES